MRVVTEKSRDYIGFGWPDRKDYVQWIEKVLTENGQQEQITFIRCQYGCYSHDDEREKLPDNVKAIVEDCGYSTVNQSCNIN